MKRLVIVPVYNEEKSVENVLCNIRKVFNGDILIINDGSTDRSAEIIRRFTDIRSLTHPQNLGYGRTLIDGFNFALENGYDRMVTIDCDEQHQPQAIPMIFESMGSVDIFSGSRYLHETISDDAPPPDRYSINMKITKKINDITGYNLTDSFCGMKGYTVKALKPMDLRESGYGFPIEFWIQVHRFGLTVKEFAVERIYKNLNRSFGEKLDNPDVRLVHYLEILNREVQRWSISSPLERTRTM